MSDKPKPGDPDYNIILDKLSWEETPRPCGRMPENIGQGIPESLFR
jgi:hypothetical protein